MAAKERRCHQVTAGLALPSPGDSTKKVPKPRNRGTGPKLFSKCVTREMLQGQFHLPMEEAGKSWGVSTTIVKRVCRTFGIERWPYRQIQSARKRIDKLQEKLRAGGRTATEREKIKDDICTLEAKAADLLINPNPQHHRSNSDVDVFLPLPTGRLSPSSRSLPLAARDSASYKEGGGRGTGAGKRVDLDGGGGGGGGDGGDGCKHDETDMPDDEAGKPVFGLSLARGVAKKKCRKNSYREAAKVLGAPPAAGSTAAANRRSRAPQQAQLGQRGQRGQQGTKRLATAASSSTAPTPPVTAPAVTGGSLRKHKRARTGGRKSTTASPPDTTHPAKVSTAKVSSGLVNVEQVGVLVGLDHKMTRVVASVSPLMRRQVTTTPPTSCSEGEARLEMNSVGEVGGIAKTGGIRTPIASIGTSRGRNDIGCEGAGTSQAASEALKSVGVDWAVSHAETGWSGVERTSWTPLMTTQNIGAGSLQECGGKHDTVVGDGTDPVSSKANSCISETTADLSGADEESPLPIFELDQPARVNSGGEAVRDAGRDAMCDAGHESVDITGGQAGAVGLDDLGLESSLMLDITAACNSGTGSTSSSWLPLSVGSYLNTEEAFTAFAISPCEFVPGGW